MSLRMKGLLVVIGLCVSAMVVPPAVAVAEKAIQDVFVTNTAETPVPVAGTVEVSERTSVIWSDTFVIANIGDRASSGPIDTSAAKQVRLIVGCTGNGLGGSCSPVRLGVHLVPPSGPEVLLEFADTPFSTSGMTRLYDLPGTRLRIEVVAMNGDATNNVTVTLVG